MTGWNLPPGCTSADIDRAMGMDATCDVCCHPTDSCICPECPKCGEAGRIACYGVTSNDPDSHGLVLSDEQYRSRRLDEIEHLQSQIDGVRQVLEYIDELGKQTDDDSRVIRASLIGAEVLEMQRKK